MSQRPPSGSSFTQQDRWPEDQPDPLSEDFEASEAQAESGDQTPEQEPPQGAEEAGPPSDETEATGQQEEAAQQEDQTEPSAEEPYLWAGRWDDPEEMEQGYLELRYLQTRTAEERNRAQAEAEALREALEQVTPYLERRGTEGYDATWDDEYGYGDAGLPADPLAVVDQLVEQRLAGIEERMESERDFESAQSQIARLRATHPEITPGSEWDHAIGDIVEEFNLEMGDEGMLTDAYEAANDPVLLSVLRGNPDFWESEDGMELARFMADMRRQQEGGARQQAEQDRQAQIRAAHSVSGPTGVPPSGESPRDDFDDVLDEWKGTGKRRSLFTAGA